MCIFLWELFSDECFGYRRHVYLCRTVMERLRLKIRCFHLTTNLSSLVDLGNCVFFFFLQKSNQLPCRLHCLTVLAVYQIRAARISGKCYVYLIAVDVKRRVYVRLDVFRSVWMFYLWSVVFMDYWNFKTQIWRNMQCFQDK